MIFIGPSESERRKRREEKVIHTEPRHTNDREFFDSVVVNRFENAFDRTYETLLWRGFPVEKKDGEIFLKRHKHSYDITILERNLRIEGLGDRTDASLIWGEPSLFKIEPNTNIDALVEIFNCDDVKGMGGGDTDFTWEGFLYGEREVDVATVRMDRGVALLIQAFPLLGLCTLMSCDGHGSRPGEINFYGKYNLKWGEIVLPLFLDKQDALFRSNWEFIMGSRHDWSSYIWRFQQISDFGDRQGWYSFLSTLQRLARNILFDGRAEGVLRFKREELEDPSEFNGDDAVEKVRERLKTYLKENP